MGFCKSLTNCFKSACRNYTWFSMVAMNGEEGDRRFREIYCKNKV